MIEKVFSNFIDFDFLDIDCQKIENYCYQLKEEDNTGIIKSNCSGWHSRQFFQNDFDYTQKSLFVNAIEKKLEDFSLNLNLNRKLIVTDFWVNINSTGAFNLPHMHPGSLLSGCLYIKVPKEKSGEIIFENPIFDLIWSYCSRWNIKEKDFNDMFTLKWYHTPEMKKCLIFPSWLKHSVAVNLSNEDRISIAFNVGVSN
jgi:uncharacterized protein (TIGR02466 family)